MYTRYISIVMAVLVMCACAHAGELIMLDDRQLWADRSKIKTGHAVLYDVGGPVVAINAGHGTEGGDKIKVLCHPDGSPKVVSGSTKKGATEAFAVAPGMRFPDGTREGVVDLRLARIVRDALLEEGVSVLMIRDGEDVQLDNVARTLIANAHAVCHVSLHFDATSNDKGLFAIKIPDDETYLKMEPVASFHKEHEALAERILESARRAGLKIYGDGWYVMDLTQMSYSTIPTACIECGDSASDVSDASLRRIAASVVEGIKEFLSLRMQLDSK